MHRYRQRLVAFGVAVVALLMLAAVRTALTERQDVRWWKGNLHTHSLWSDGTDFPEMIAGWYRDQGYHFLAFTEHDLLQQGERWVDINAPDAGWPPRNRSTRDARPGYRAAFGDAWVEERVEGGRHLVRLKRLDEYRQRFEEPGRFLLLTGEEVTDAQGAHLNVINLDAAILPRGGPDPATRIRNNLAAVAERRAAGSPPLAAIVNHPNFVWALTAEEIAAIPDARLFEVYNGHLLVNNAGDSVRAGTERMWDVMLSLRHANGLRPIYGVANDDAHDYREHADTISRPGRAWTMVRAQQLTAERIVAALEAGDFYASTGVTLRDVVRGQRRMRIEVEPQPGARYRIQFIGTRLTRPLEGRPVIGADGEPLRTTRRYDEGIGEVLAEIEGVSGEYVFRGDERYVRARIVSSLPHIDPATGRALGRQTAWVQPIFR